MAIPNEMAIARVEVKRICIRPDICFSHCFRSSAVDGIEGHELYISFDSSPDVRVDPLGLRTASQQEAMEEPRRVPCAVNRDLRNVVFVATQRTDAEGKPQNKDFTVELACRVWYQQSTAWDATAALSDASSSVSLTSVLCNKEPTKEKEMIMERHWELLASGSAKAMRHGAVTIDLGVVDAQAKERSTPSVSLSLFVEPLLFADEIKGEEVGLSERAMPTEDKKESPSATVGPKQYTLPPPPLKPGVVKPSDGATTCQTADCAEATVVLPKEGSVADSGRNGATLPDPARDGMSSVTVPKMFKYVTARWMLFAHIPPPVDFPHDNRNGVGGEEARFATGDSNGVNITNGAAEAVGGYTGLWRLALYGACGHILARGSPFSDTLYKSSGWCDALVAVGDDVVVSAGVTLHLQVLKQPLTHKDMNNGGVGAMHAHEISSYPLAAAGSTWITVVSTKCVPVESLLAPLRDFSMLDVPLDTVKVPSDTAEAAESLFAAGMCTPVVHACLVRVPTVVDRLKTIRQWLRAIKTVAAHFFTSPNQTTAELGPSSKNHQQAPSRHQGYRNTTRVCIVELNVTVAVLKRVTQYVDVGASWPLISLSASGGRDAVIEVASVGDIFPDRCKEGDAEELRRAPGARLDVVVQATVDETNPIILLTLHSPTSKDLLFGHAVFSPFELANSVGHVWLPVRYAGNKNFQSDGMHPDSSALGWIHCSYNCAFSSEDVASSAVAAADRELLQQPVLSPSTPLVAQYLTSPFLTEALRWNCLELCIVEVGDMHQLPDLKGSINNNSGGAAISGISVCNKSLLYASVHLISKSTHTPFVTPAAAFDYPRWNCSFRLNIRPQTTHLAVQILVGDGVSGESESVGFLTMPRVVTSKFWTTESSDGMWLPLIATNAVDDVPQYCGSVLVQWRFSCMTSVHENGSNHVRAAMHIVRKSSPSCNIVNSIRYCVGDNNWLQFERVELSLPWLLRNLLHNNHESKGGFQERDFAGPKLRMVLLMRSGNFIQRSELMPAEAGGFLFCVRETVFLPLSDQISVSISFQYVRSEAGLQVVGNVPPEAYSETFVIATGNLFLSDEDVTGLVDESQNCLCRRVLLKLETQQVKPLLRLSPGLLAAEIRASKLERCCSKCWAWPQPHLAAFVELRIGRVFMPQSENSVERCPETPTGTAMSWTVYVREKGSRCSGERNYFSGECASDTALEGVSQATIRRSGCGNNNMGGDDVRGNGVSSYSGAASSLYLHWPPTHEAADHNRRPPPPTVELLLSTTAPANSADAGDAAGGAAHVMRDAPAFVGTLSLNLSKCFASSSGTGLFEIYRSASQAPNATAEDEVIGYVELSYKHNFSEVGPTNDCVNESSDARRELNAEDEGNTPLLLLTVVDARYREHYQRNGDGEGASCKAPLTSFVVGVGQMSWNTTEREGISPHFGCSMLFNCGREEEECKDGGGMSDGVAVRLQMTPGTPDTLSSRSANVQAGYLLLPPSIAVLHLQRNTTSNEGKWQAQRCWLSLFSTMADIGGSHCVTGEVLVQWRWIAYSPTFWSYIAPLSVSVEPVLECSLAGNTLASMEFESVTTEPGATSPTYITVFVSDFVFASLEPIDNKKGNEERTFAVNISILDREDTNITVPLLPVSSNLAACASEGQAGFPQLQYGDCTSAASLNLSTECVHWDERCMLPLYSRNRTPVVLFQLRCGVEPFDVIGEGCLSWAEVQSHGTHAIPIFAAVGKFREDPDSYQSRCGTLTVSVKQTPFFIELMPCDSVDSKPADGVDGPRESLLGEGLQHVDGVAPCPSTLANSPPLTILLQLCVNRMEINGWCVVPTVDDLWGLAALADTVHGNGSSRQVTQLVPVPTSDITTNGFWSGVFCVQNSSEVDVCLYRINHTLPSASVKRKAKLEVVYGRFSLNLSLLEDGTLSSASHRVELREITNTDPSDANGNSGWNVVGYVDLSCRPLLHSGKVYDPHTVFFQRCLRVQLLQLKGIIRFQSKCLRARGYGRKWRGRRPLVGVQLQCGSAIVNSLPLALPAVRSASAKRNEILADDGNEVNVGSCTTPHFKEPLECLLSGAADVHVSLYIQCNTTESENSANVAPHLHFSSDSHAPQHHEVCGPLTQLRIGEGTATVSPQYHDNEKLNVEHIKCETLWVQLGGSRHGKTASAQLQCHWKQQIVLGTWLSCISWCGSMVPVHQPWLIFKLRFPGGEACSISLDLSGKPHSGVGRQLGQRSAVGQVAATVAAAYTPWCFSYIHLPITWPMGACIECIELYDTVADDTPVLLGVHEWGVADALLLAPTEVPSNGDVEASLHSVATRSLSLHQVGHRLTFGKHTLLFAKSRCPPETTDSERLCVPFSWWPESAELHFNPTESIVGILGAASLRISCVLTIGHRAGGRWEWQEVTESWEGQALHILADTSTAIVTASWGNVNFHFKPFSRFFALEELRKGPTCYALRAKISCHILPENAQGTMEPPSVLRRDARPAFPEMEAIFVLDDHSGSVNGKRSLELVECKTTGEGSHEKVITKGSLALAWSVKHDSLALCRTEGGSRMETSGVKGGDLLAQHEAPIAVSDAGCASPSDDPLLFSLRPPAVWEVAFVEMCNVSIAQLHPEDRSGESECPIVPVVLQLLAYNRQHRRRRHKASEHSLDSLPTRASTLCCSTLAGATPMSDSPFSLCRVRVAPGWLVDSEQWAGSDRVLKLSLWQKNSIRESQGPALGCLRLDKVLRDIAEQVTLRSNVAGGIESYTTQEEVATDWIPLKRHDLPEERWGLARLLLRSRMCSPPSANRYNKSARVDIGQLPVCIEVVSATMHAVNDVDKFIHSGQLVLSFCSGRGNKNGDTLSCSSTGLEVDKEGKMPQSLQNDEQVAAGEPTGALRVYPLFIESSVHTLLLTGVEKDKEDSAGDGELGVSVYLTHHSDKNGLVGDGRTNKLVGGLGQGSTHSQLALQRLRIDQLAKEHEFPAAFDEGRKESGPTFISDEMCLTLNHEAFRVDLRMHVVLLLRAEERVPNDFKGAIEPSGLSAHPPGGPCFLHCVSNNCGNDNSKGRGGVLCKADNVIFKVADGGEVFRLDLRFAEDGFGTQPSGVITGSTSCFPHNVALKWTPLNEGKLIAGDVNKERCCYRSFGQYAWFYGSISNNGGCIIVDGTFPFVTTASALSLRKPAPPSAAAPPCVRGRRRIKQRSRKEMFKTASDAPHESKFRCYSLRRRCWGMINTKGSAIIDEKSSNGVPAPAKRVFHSAVLIGRKLWVFGGCKVSGEISSTPSAGTADRPIAGGVLVVSSSSLLNELLCLDLDTCRWTSVASVAPMSGCPSPCADLTDATDMVSMEPLPPPPVACHTAVEWNDQMIVFGGLIKPTSEAEALEPSDGLYVFQASCAAWWLCSPRRVPATERRGSNNLKGPQWPAARYGHAAAAVPDHPNGAIIILGGATQVVVDGMQSPSTLPTPGCCPFSELLWVYYAAFGIWRNVAVPVGVPLTWRVFASLHVVTLSTEPRRRYTAVVDGGCDTNRLESPSYHQSLKALGTPSLEINDCGMVSILSVVLSTPPLSTTWFTLDGGNM